jgi:putative ABC transport system ATP-binding protein
MLKITDLAVSFQDAARSRFDVLNIANFTADPGELIVLTGSSGSGKTTLMQTACGLQAVDRGHITWGDTDLSLLTETARDRWRRDQVGLVFQDFQLIEELSPLDNVLVPAWFGQYRAGALVDRATALLSEFGVPAQRRRLSDLSRGERQRTAFARALLFDPLIILADEPTASLDAASGAVVIDRLRSLARDAGRFVMAVSHDPAMIAAADRLVRLDRGHLIEELAR